MPPPIEIPVNHWCWLSISLLIYGWRKPVPVKTISKIIYLMVILLFLIINYQTNTTTDWLPLFIRTTNNNFKGQLSILTHMNYVNPCSLCSAGVWFNVAVWGRWRLTTVYCIIIEERMYSSLLFIFATCAICEVPADDEAHAWPEGLGIQLPFW